MFRSTHSKRSSRTRPARRLGVGVLGLSVFVLSFLFCAPADAFPIVSLHPINFCNTIRFCSGSTYQDENYSNRNFTNADLSGVRFIGDNFTDATFTGANLSGTTFADDTLNGVVSGGIQGSPAALQSPWMLVGGYLVGPSANLNGAELGFASLSGADLLGANLTNADLSAANLTNAYTSYVDLSGAELRDANLAQDLLYGDNFTNANFTDADLAGTDLYGATFTGVSSGGIVGSPIMDPPNWEIVDGYLVGPGANLGFANLSGANLYSADLSGADLMEADLAGDNMYEVNLSLAWLGSANLSGAYDFYMANTIGTGWNNTTCPNGTNSNDDNFTCVLPID
jgi:uncharacterized protein YjbI with pentapeptide repeats